jgi:hypothetical protein
MPATYCEVSPETLNVFIKKISEKELDHYVDIHIMSDDNQKDIGKVTKCNELVKYLTDFEVIIVVNDIVFFQLEPTQQEIVVEELLARIHYDTEKDKLMIVKPDTNTFSLLLDKYGLKQYQRVQETITSLYHKKKEDTTSAKGVVIEPLI